MDIEKQAIKLNFRWRCYKEKVYLKVLVRLVQKIVRFTILLEGMFGLLIMPTLRSLDIQINFLCGYGKNQLSRELSLQEKYELDEGLNFVMNFTKEDLVK